MKDTINLMINGVPCSGQPGQTILEVARQAQIDIPTLCHDPRLAPYASCGLCVVEIAGMGRLMRACATTIGEGQDILTDSPRVRASRQNTLELLLSDHKGDCRPPCMLACPAQTDCQGYVGLIANGKYREAVALIKEKLPLPASIGLVCPHPCENACRRALVEAPVAIADLKAFVGEFDLAGGDPYLPSIASSSGKRVAVVGAGPAGLTTAYFLARNGHKVTVYDAMPEAGGMLRYGIPEYRLPKATLDLEIDLIKRLGVEFKMNTRLETDISLNDLRSNHDAVFLGIGAWKSSKIRCPGEDLPGVLGGIDFLREVALTGQAPMGKRVAVIGGGNTAMDAARTAVRLGAEEVIVLYRRTRQEMPAEAREIDEAMEEGVKFKFLCAPLEITGEDRMNGIKLQMMQLGEPDASGRRKPEPIEGAQEWVPLDTIIAAIGQEVTCPAIDGLNTDKWGNVLADKANSMTSLEGVFAGGDAVTGPGIAIEAIAQGQQAAHSISAYLRGNTWPNQPPYLVQRQDITADTLAAVPKSERCGHTLVEAGERSNNFGQVTLTMTAQAAVKEASRCLECGCQDYFECRLINYARAYEVHPERLQGAHRSEVIRERHSLIRRDSQKCILCGLCVRICSEVMGVEALGLVGRGFDTMVKPMFGQPLDEAGCISCGQCAAVCPTGALVETTALAKSVPLELGSTMTTCAGCSLGCKQVMQHHGSVLVRAIPSTTNILCHEGRAGWYGSQQERLITPMIKRDGVLEPASWEEACKRISRRINENRSQVSNEAVSVVVSPRLTDEEVAAVIDFARAKLDTDNITAPHIESAALLKAIITDNNCWQTIDDLVQADHIIMVGSFDRSTIVPARIRTAVKRGATLTVLASCPTLVDDITAQKGQENDLAGIYKAMLARGSYNADPAVAEQLPSVTVGLSADQYAAAAMSASRPLVVIDGMSISEKTAEWLGYLVKLLNDQGGAPAGILLAAEGGNSQGVANRGIKPLGQTKPGGISFLFGVDAVGSGKWSPEEAAELGLLVVGATHLNPTARLADVVIPWAMPWETEGHYQDAAGHIRQLNQVLPPVTGSSNLERLAQLSNFSE